MEKGELENRIKELELELSLLKSGKVESPLLENESSFYNAGTDPTGQRKVENLKKESEEKFKLIFEKSIAPIMVADDKGNYLEVNKAAAEIFEYSIHELMGMNVGDLITTSNPNAVAQYEEYIKKGEETGEFGFISKKGTSKIVQYQAVRIKPDYNLSILMDVTEQKQASQYARSLIEASLDPLVTISANGKITDVNEASIKVTGVEREKLIDTDFSNYFTEPNKAQEGYRQVFEKGFVADYPLTIKHKNGNLTDVLYNASVYKDDKGNVLGVFAAARDVTLQKQIEDELLKTQERLNAGLKIANIALSEISYITNTVRLSPESAAMYGFPKNQLEVTRQQMHDTFHPAIKAELEAQIIIAMNPESGGYMALEHPIVLPSGDIRWLKVNKQFLYDHSTQPAKPVYSILVSQDITERKESSQYARSLIEASLDPLVTISATGKILDVNEASIKVTGIPREMLIGTNFSNYFTDPKKAQEGYLQVFEKGFVSDYPLTIKHKDGNLTDVLYNASVYKDNRGNVLGVFAAARDVTEQKWAKDLRAANIELAYQNEEKEKRAAELAIANKELLAFTYVSSHDLQEPLRKIQIFATVILKNENNNLSDDGKYTFQRMRLAAGRMQQLIEDLLAFSRVSTTDHKFEKTHLNIIMNEVKAELKDIIQEKHATIEATELCPANIIPFQFRQLMYNLISNAIKFARADVPSHIIIKSRIEKGNKLNNEKLSLEKKYCHIIVKDNGIGFEPHFSERIFEVFQKLHSKEKFVGTGIGLAIVKKIVENHNGIIIATSELNQGALFDIFIPSD